MTLRLLPLLSLCALPFSCRRASDQSDPQDTDTDSDSDSDADTDADSDTDYGPAWDELSSRIADHLADASVPGMQVAIVIDGQLAYTGSFGVARYGGSEAVTDDTVFRWASVTKMHTAAAVLQLAEEGAIDLDDPVVDHFPTFQLEEGFDTNGITIHECLTHTAALPDALDWQCGTNSSALQGHFATWNPPLYGEDGRYYNYSNTGFSLVGAMMEEIDGAQFPDLMQDRVLTPAGMVSATFDVDVAAAGPHADGTSWDGSGPFYFDLAEWDCGPSRPAAWLHGTATDLARTAEWQLAGGGDVLEESSVLAMHAQENTHYNPDGSHVVGYGQFSYAYKDADVVMHDGWVSGFVSTWAIVPDRGFGVAVVSNADWADVYTPMYDAMDLFLDLEDVDPIDYTTDPGTWGPYAGTYEDPYVWGTVTVSLVDESLRVAFPDFDHETVLYQSAGDSFWFEWSGGGWYDVRFIADDEGVFRWFVSRPGVATRGQTLLPTSSSLAWRRDQIQRYGLAERPDPRRRYGVELR